MPENLYIKETFPVLGMSCSSCAVSVETTLSAQKGIKEAKVNFAASTVLVEYDKNVITSADMQRALQGMGYNLVVQDGATGVSEAEALQHEEYHRLKNRTVGAIVLSLPVFIIGMFFMHMPYGDWIMLLFTIPVLGIFGRSFFINAFRQLKHGKANMDTLVAVSTGIAFLFSFFNTVYPEYWTSRGLEAHVYYEAASVIIALILLGKFLEGRAKSNTSSAIRKLMGLQPQTVIRVNADGSETEVPVKIVQPGDILVVKPGDKIPVDGIVRDGVSFVDESMITGESVPVEKTSGMKIFTGTINQKGSLRFEAEKVGSETVLAHIIKMVQEAQGSKAPVQTLVDRIAGIFVPVVIGIAVITFIIWMIAGGEQAFTHALLTSVTVLVIACPCALGLATPTAIMVGIGKGAENNILIRDAESLEVMHRVNAIVLDKTGTITEGKPVVTEVVWGSETEKHRDILLGIERRSEHPLADAVVSYLQQSDSTAVEPENFESITGQGVKGIADGETYFVGNRRLLEEQGIKFTDEQLVRADGFRTAGNTVVFFADTRSIIAMVAIADKIKETSAQAIRQLQNSGVEVYMLTGDNEITARAVAEQVGVKHFKAEVMPSDKAGFVKELQQQGNIVAMVGDGINDSQALAQADISIAMGKGSDIAIDVARITLITSDLNIIPKALTLSRQTVKAIRQNLFWAFIYNLIGIPLAAGVLYPFFGFLLNPMIAAAAMAFSSVSVVTNSLRIRRKKLTV